MHMNGLDTIKSPLSSFIIYVNDDLQKYFRIGENIIQNVFFPYAHTILLGRMVICQINLFRRQCTYLSVI